MYSHVKTPELELVGPGGSPNSFIVATGGRMLNHH